jgi:hypothetical protein
VTSAQARFRPDRVPERVAAVSGGTCAVGHVVFGVALLREPRAVESTAKLWGVDPRTMLSNTSNWACTRTSSLMDNVGWRRRRMFA